MPVFKVGQKRMRLIHQIAETGASIMIDIDSKSYPVEIEMPLYELDEVDIEEVVYPSEELLSEKERRRFESSKKIISEVTNELSGERIVERRLRHRTIAYVAKKNNVSYSKVRSLIIKYWKSGMILTSVAVMYPRNQGKRKRQSSKGFVVTKEDEMNFDNSIRKHYLTRELKPLMHAYEQCIKDYYSNSEGGRLKLMKKIPSYNQFYYVFIKKYDGNSEVTKARYGEVVAKEIARPLIGNTKSANAFPTYELDSTILDSYTLEYFEGIQHADIIGRPVIYLIVETISSRIAFFYLSYEKFMSEVASVNSLIYGLSCPQKYMGMMGIETEEYDGFIPNALVFDRGELTGSGIIEAITRMGITTNITGGMRASYKPKVERLIGKINSELAKYVHGTIKKDKKHNPRTEKDYRLRSSLTIQDMAKICHRVILQHNNHDVVEGFVDLSYRNGKYTPNHIFSFLSSQYGIVNRTLDEKNAIMMLLSAGDATVTESGIRFKKMDYISRALLKSGWIEKARIKGRFRIKVKYNPIDVQKIYIYDEKTRTLDEVKLTEKFSEFIGLTFYEVELFFEERQSCIDKQKRSSLEEKINGFEEIDGIIKEAKKRKELTKDGRSNNSKVKSIGINRNTAIAIEQNQHRQNLLVEEKPDLNESSVDANDRNDDLDLIIKAIGKKNEKS